MTPPGHERAKTIIPLSDFKLGQADPYLVVVAQCLGRTPTYMSGYTTKLLQRNFSIVKDTMAAYAFGQFEDPFNHCTLKGGSGRGDTADSPGFSKHENS